MRHNKVCTHLHYSTYKGLGIETTGIWYTRPLKPMYEQADVKVLWNQAVQTEREFTENRPDVIINTRKIKQAYRLLWQYPQTEMSRKRKRKIS